MALGRKIAVLFCCACAASTLLLIALVAPALSNRISLGKPLCVPGVSIKCYDSDCGDHYLRCGSAILHDVPAGQVCFHGALLPSKRPDLHRCGHSTPRNSTLKFLGGCSSCSALCPGQQATCSCECSLNGNTKVVCSGKTYANSATAQCCGCNAISTTYYPSIWEALQESLESWLRQCAEPLVWFFENIDRIFTFPAPLLSDCCTGSGACASSVVCP